MENKEPVVTAIIVAAGTGTRMGGVEKPLIRLGGKTVFSMLLESFSACSTVRDIIVVCRSDTNLRPIASGFTAKPITFVQGGSTRAESVMNGVRAAADSDIVCIHDGARPFITAQQIDDVVSACLKTGASCACRAVSDTIKFTDGNGHAEYTPPRDRLIAVQTPQVFRRDLYLVSAAVCKKKKLGFTDDTSLAESAGFSVTYIDIGDGNDKLTTVTDIKRAKARVFLEERFEKGE